jgi:heterogeneous nuclear ribonucleoprotein F/H
MKRNILKNTAFLGIASSLALSVLLMPVNCQAQDSASGLKNSWWMQAATQNEKANKPKDSFNQTSPSTNDKPVFSYGGLSNNSNKAGQYGRQVRQNGAFIVPSYFASQPTPYERPLEIPVTSGIGGVGMNTGMGAFQSTLPFVLSGGNPWSFYSPYGFGGPYLGGLGYGGFGGYGLGGMGIGGYGLGGYGLGGYGLGGLGFGGYGLGYGFMPSPLAFGAFGGLGAGSFGGMGGMGAMGMFSPYNYGFYCNPGFGSIMMGAFGNSLNRSGLGEVGRAKFIQTAPSKASGNYYAPSTVDTSASGSYYATGQPASQIVVPSNGNQPKDYWGNEGNPFGDKVNSVPWSN